MNIQKITGRNMRMGDIVFILIVYPFMLHSVYLYEMIFSWNNGFYFEVRPIP